MKLFFYCFSIVRVMADHKLLLGMLIPEVEKQLTEMPLHRTHTFTQIYTSRNNFGISSSTTRMYLGRMRKPENLEETQMNTADLQTDSNPCSGIETDTLEL